MPLYLTQVSRAFSEQYQGAHHTAEPTLQSKIWGFCDSLHNIYTRHIPEDGILLGYKVQHLVRRQALVVVNGTMSAVFS